LAVAIEFVNMIVRKSAIERCFPGGLDGFARQDLGNLTEDDHLLRVGFMSTRDAVGFVSELEAAGLRYLGLEPDSDIAVVVGTDGTTPPWLCVGAVNGYPACWASGHPPGEVAWPEPSFLLRCPRPVYDALPEVARECGAALQEVAVEAAEGVLAQRRCVRGQAEVLIDAFGERQGDSPVGLWGRHQLMRRRQRREDGALLRDLVAALIRAGAEGDMLAEPGAAADRAAPHGPAQL
jgi:hypothetical protein